VGRRLSVQLRRVERDLRTVVWAGPASIRPKIALTGDGVKARSADDIVLTIILALTPIDYMKITSFLCFAGLLLAPLANADQTITYPEDEPIFSISFPDDWEVEGDEESVSASSKDELVNMELIALEAEALKDAVKMAKEALTEELEGLKFKDEPEKGEMNGMDVIFLNAEVTIEGIKMAVNVCLFAPKKADTCFMLFNIVPFEALEDHVEEISKIVNSVKVK
jgi:hypothetical protein